MVTFMDGDMEAHVVSTEDGDIVLGELSEEDLNELYVATVAGTPTGVKMGRRSKQPGQSTDFVNIYGKNFDAIYEPPDDLKKLSEYFFGMANQDISKYDFANKDLEKLKNFLSTKELANSGFYELEIENMKRDNTFNSALEAMKDVVEKDMMRLQNVRSRFYDSDNDMYMRWFENSGKLPGTEEYELAEAKIYSKYFLAFKEETLKKAMHPENYRTLESYYEKYKEHLKKLKSENARTSGLEAYRRIIKRADGEDVAADLELFLAGFEGSSYKKSEYQKIFLLVGKKGQPISRVDALADNPESYEVYEGSAGNSSQILDKIIADYRDEGVWENISVLKAILESMFG
jgi:hypothetical protein